MIDNESLVYWQQYAPWSNPTLVEQDLIISRALVDIFNHPLLKEELVFRGGTALQKCFYEKATRYSEDIDCVQLNAGPIGPIFDALHDTLNPWLGQPKAKRGPGRATFIYRFLSTTENKQMRLKIEINTREHYNFLDLIEKEFSVACPWYSGACKIKTYQIDELLGTKLRALYQRKKGRDLFDMARSIDLLPINVGLLLKCFNQYLERENIKISRAEFEANLLAKKDMEEFRRDMAELLSYNTQHDFEQDFNLVMKSIISKLPGEPWKGIEG